MEVHLLLMDGVLPVEHGHLFLLKNIQVALTKSRQWIPATRDYAISPQRLNYKLDLIVFLNKKMH